MPFYRFFFPPSPLKNGSAQQETKEYQLKENSTAPQKIYGLCNKM